MSEIMADREKVECDVENVGKVLEKRKNNNCYTIVGEINSSTFAQFFDFLIKVKRSLALLIYSNGGDITSAMNICRAIQSSKLQITTVGIGEISSAATSIFMSGQRRILVSDTRFTVHKGRMTYSNVTMPEEKLAMSYDFCCKGTKEMWAPLIENSKITYPLLMKKCKNRDWTLTDEEIRKYGITTENCNDWFDLFAQR